MKLIINGLPEWGPIRDGVMGLIPPILAEYMSHPHGKVTDPDVRLCHRQYWGGKYWVFSGNMFTRNPRSTMFDPIPKVAITLYVRESNDAVVSKLPTKPARDGILAGL